MRGGSKVRLKLAAVIVLLLVAGGAVFVSIGGLGTPAATATTLLTAPATVTDVSDEIAATGTVETSATYALAFGAAPTISDGSSSASSSSSTGAGSSSVTWRVSEVKVGVGATVAKGQVLAVAKTTDLDAQIAAADRAAKAAALQLSVARTNRADATTTAAIRQTQIAVYNAESANANAKATLADLNAQKPLATLSAPAAGIVTAVNVRTGVDAPSGTAITMISSELEVTTSVVESDVASISVGQDATITVSAINATLRGAVASIDPVGTATGNNGVVNYSVNVTLAAPPPALRPGMSADISIVAASATNVVAIPARALSGTAGAYTVRVVAQDGSVSVLNVDVGLLTSSLAEIKSGLQAGERVVTGTSSSQNAANGGFGGGAFPGGGIIRGGGGGGGGGGGNATNP